MKTWSLSGVVRQLGATMRTRILTRWTLLPKGSSDLDRPLRLEAWLDPRGLDHRKTLLPKGKSDLDRPPRLQVYPLQVYLLQVYLLQVYLLQIYLLPTTRSPSPTLPSHCLLKRKSLLAQQIQALFESVTKVSCQDSHLTVMPNKDLAG